MIIAIGRFGPYAKHKGAFYSLPKTDDPYTVNLERATEIIKTKRQADIDKVIKLFPENPDIKILNGRWGPYLAFGKKNIRIPKDKDPKSLTLEECLEMEKNFVPSKGRKGNFTRRKKAE